MEVSIYTDGASRGNPGRASYGFALYDGKSGMLIYTEAMYLGIKTNNEAEYIAVYQGLKRAIEMGYTNIHFFLDSELVVKQLTGVYKVKKEELKAIFSAIQMLTLKTSLRFSHVPREKNKKADALANYALDYSKEIGTLFKNVLLT